MARFLNQNVSYLAIVVTDGQLVVVVVVVVAVAAVVLVFPRSRVRHLAINNAAAVNNQCTRLYNRQVERTLRTKESVIT